VLEVESVPQVPTFSQLNIVGPLSGFHPGLGSASGRMGAAKCIALALKEECDDLVSVASGG